MQNKSKLSMPLPPHRQILLSKPITEGMRQDGMRQDVAALPHE